MAEDNPFDSYRRCSNRLLAKQPRNQPKRQPAQAAKKIASASRAPSTLQLRPEDRPVTLFVPLIVGKLGHEAGRSHPRDKYLSPININRTVFAGMIHFKDSGSETWVQIWFFMQTK